MKCLLCKRRMWPWQKKSLTGKFHELCYLQHRSDAVYRETQQQYEPRVKLYPGDRNSITVTAEEIRQMRLRAKQEDQL